ncbi:MAG TPA: hypothetical protein P5533_03325 [Candidatus Cloacimonadota bacterium]|nr:hypothetical protein [Candidatus Cloacimonadota bacterium]
MKKLFFVTLILTLLSILNAQTDFDINAFADTTKYGWADYAARKTYREDLSQRQQLLQLYEMDAQTVSSNLLKSAVVPGWGQFSAKQPVKGEIILGLEIITLGTSLLFYDKAMNYYRKYETATQVNEIEQFYKKAQSPYQYSMIFAGLGLVVWVYNLYDVASSTDIYNTAVWNEIVRKYSKSPLQLTPQGIQLNF